MSVTAQHPLQNWIPLRIIHDPSSLLIEWMHVGDKPFTEPFFDDTVSAIRYATVNRRFKSVSTTDMLLQWCQEMRSVQPAAFIFHVSRCGSTLVSQMLSLDPQNIVLSEVPFFDEILRMPFKNRAWNSNKTLLYLQAAIKFYAQKRHDKQQFFFVKTDSWHLHFHDVLRTAFPNIPFILLYRNPAEVLQSQQKKRGMHAIPGVIEQELFGLPNPVSFDLDIHLANVLASYFRQMMHIVNTDPLAIPFNYRDGIQNLASLVYSITGRDISTELEEQFESRSRYHAKEPSQSFTEDYNGEHIPAILETAWELYCRLDKHRLQFMERSQGVTE